MNTSFYCYKTLITINYYELTKEILKTEECQSNFLKFLQQAIAKIQDDCAVTTLPLDRCLTSEELDTLKQLYVTAKVRLERSNQIVFMS